MRIQVKVLVAGLVLGAGCATPATSRRQVSIASVTVAAPPSVAAEDPGVQQKLRQWEEHATAWLRDRLVASGYQVMQRERPGGVVMWSLALVVDPGDRERRVASLGAEGQGTVQATLTARSWGAVLHRSVTERATRAPTWGMGILPVIDEALAALELPEARRLEAPPSATDAPKAAR